ncbi:MAG: iron-containing alcohol dehydrogenase [Candidatus Competibacterales bacterium]|nr:iron-containing alcohol dehydrogenase [Candidatus Competibacterales bacterium]
MSEDLLQRLLAGRLPDPDRAGRMLRVPTRTVAILPTLAGVEASLLGPLELGRRLRVVSDPVTHRILGRQVAEALATIASVEEQVLPGQPVADAETAERVGADPDAWDALIAVGSGTLNDLCKYAAHRLGRPYAVFATAPSMNGYASASASLTIAGHKRSLPAAAPRGIFMDLGVLAAAPPRLIRAGLGDSLCRPTAQADWLLAHLLLDQPYREAPFMLLAEDESPLLAAAGRLLDGDPEIMARLARTLVLSGFGMTLCGGSQPASQGEHLIAHYLDMMGDPTWPARFHGEDIGVTTLTLARLQQSLLAGPAPVLRPATLEQADFLQHYGPQRGASCWQAYEAKRLHPWRAELLNRRLALRWPEIRSQIQAVLRPVETLEAALRAAGAPTCPADLGIPDLAYREAVHRAREIRDRYTFLDLAADSGYWDG